MSNAILVLGESGTGKSTSFRNLDPSETFIINILDKPLPFRGYKKNYIKISEHGMRGNYFESDDHSHILKMISCVNNHRPEIKNLIIDDFGFTLINTFMGMALDKKNIFDKFTLIAQQAWEIIKHIRSQRSDLNCIITMHTDIDDNGRYKPKTIGKLVDKNNVIEGSFTYIFHTLIHNKKYLFLTNNDGMHMAKSPMGCFPELYIDNDLQTILKTINDYNN